MWRSIVSTGLLLLLQKGEGTGMGPWMAILDNITECEDANKDVPMPIMLKIDKTGKFSRTVTEGSFKTSIGVNDGFELTVRVQELKNGVRWDTVVDRNMGPACTAMNTWIGKMWRMLVQQGSIETVTEGSSLCAKPGKGDMAVPFDLPPLTVDSVPTFFYGTFKAEFIFHHPNKTVFECSMLNANVYPKQSLKG